MKDLDDGPDGLNDKAFERALRRGVDQARLRAAKLPAKTRQLIPVIPVIPTSTGGKP
jgi:hypothetical protein